MFDNQQRPIPSATGDTNAAARPVGPRPEMGPRQVDPANATLPKPAVDTAVQVFGHLAEPTSEPKPVMKPDGNTVHPDGHETQGPPTAREIAPAAGGGAGASAAPPTEAGMSNGTPGPSGGARPVANVAATEGRAHDAAARMPEADQQNYVGLMTNAKNQAQRVMMERALAAGRSMQEIEALAKRMADQDEATIMKTFTGAEIFQGFSNSCIPAAYQIAAAEMDPCYAAEVRDNPNAAVKQQGAHVVEGGGAPGMRDDLHKLPGPLAAQAEQHPELLETMRNPPEAAANSSSQGFEPTKMPGTALHNRLENTAGMEMQVLTGEGQPFKTPGAGQFPAGETPHGEIQRTLNQGVPVVFTAGGHARVIVGQTVGPDGKVVYMVQDPDKGGTGPIPAEHLEGGYMGPQSVVVPRPPQPGGPWSADPAPQPAVPIPTAASFAPRPADDANDPNRVQQPPA